MSPPLRLTREGAPGGVLLARIPGQHVAPFTDRQRACYESLGFTIERDGLSMVVGRWPEG